MPIYRVVHMYLKSLFSLSIFDFKKRKSHHCFHRAPSNTFMIQFPPYQLLCFNERFWKSSLWILKISGMGREDRAHLANWEHIPPQKKEKDAMINDSLQRLRNHATIACIIINRRSPNTYVQGRLERYKSRHYTQFHRHFQMKREIHFSRLISSRFRRARIVMNKTKILHGQ